MNSLLKKWIAIICITTISTTLFNSCKKYPDGPSFSLLTKKTRLCGTWQIDQYLINETDQTNLFNTFLPNYQLEIKTNETYVATSSNGHTEEGKWEFTNNKEHLKSTVNTTGVVNDYQILKLENKALWLKQTDANGNIVKFHFKAK